MNLQAFIKTNFPLALILATSWVIPDYFFQIFFHKSAVQYQYWMYLLLFSVACALSLARSIASITAVIFALMLIQTLEICYSAYFGGQLSASAILQFFTEYRDVLSVGICYSNYLYIAPLIVIIPSSLALLAWIKYDRERVIVRYSWLLLVLLVMAAPIEIIRHPTSTVKYYPNTSYPSVFNTYLNWSVLIFNHIPKLMMPELYKHRNNFQPVTVKKTSTPDNMTIVVIMLESITYDHMNLFGYTRKNTPYLSSLVNDPNFTWKKGISAGISTRVSFNSFWNSVRNPLNETQFIQKKSNIFRLARQAGFFNQFFSAQTANILRSSGTEYVDVLYTEELLPEKFSDHKDLALIDLANNLELHDKNFIVFHTRTAHAPYANNYMGLSKFEKYPVNHENFRHMQVNSYDNAIYYTDYIIQNLIKVMTKRVNGPIYFVVTSDHGQLFGDNLSKSYGHGVLVPEVGNVPILFYADHGADWPESIKSLSMISHYELDEFILSLLGFRIIDNNDSNGIYYINGLGYHHGENGYITINKLKYPSSPINYSVHTES